MSVKITVWYPKGANVGDASINFHGTYMSWWPGGNASKVNMVKMFAGGPGAAPTFESDKESEGGEPDWAGDHFGWENDDKAIEHWRKIYFSDLQKGISAMRDGNKGATYSFVSNNCCDVVDKLLETAGAYNWEIRLNLWRSIKLRLAPKDIATISAYVAGQKSVLNHPNMWSPSPEMGKS